MCIHYYIFKRNSYNGIVSCSRCGPVCNNRICCGKNSFGRLDYYFIAAHYPAIVAGCTINPGLHIGQHLAGVPRVCAYLRCWQELLPQNLHQGARELVHPPDRLAKLQDQVTSPVQLLPGHQQLMMTLKDPHLRKHLSGAAKYRLLLTASCSSAFVNLLP